MASVGSMITFRVYDIHARPYDVQLTIDEQAAQGTLAIRQEGAGAAQQHTLSAIQKSQNDKTLQCKVGMATATISIEDGQNPPQLRLQARLFVPIINETYTLQPAEQQRLSAWIHSLHLGGVA